jgi:hypothetical protein
LTPEKLPGVKSASVSTSFVTKLCNNLVLEIVWSLLLQLRFSEIQRITIPYKQETDATTKISRRPESRDEVVLNRIFSSSSLMDKSFNENSCYGINASGWYNRSRIQNSTALFGKNCLNSEYNCAANVLLCAKLVLVFVPLNYIGNVNVLPDPVTPKWFEIDRHR